MNALAVDDFYAPSNNGAMAEDDRRKIGRRLRALRVERGLTQRQLANARAVRVAVGTIQSIERGSRETRDTNVERVAAYLGTSLSALRAGDIHQPDPRVKGLNEEAIAVARRFVESTTTIRNRVIRLLNRGESDRALQIALRYERLTPEQQARIDIIVTQFEGSQQPPRGNTQTHKPIAK